MSEKIQKAIDSLTDPQSDAEWKEHDAGVRKLVLDAQKALDGAKASVKKVQSAAKKTEKFKWSGNQYAYMRSAAEKLQAGIDRAEDDLDRALSSLG